jgi:putative ABC transport system substrate-binding protein
MLIFREGPLLTITRLTVLLLLAALVMPAAAQKPAPIAKIGFLTPAEAPPIREALRQGLQELGYAESRNVLIEYRSAQGDFNRLPILAAELVRLEVDVIVAFVTQASLAAKQATQRVPIVMVGVADPVGTGLVTSLSRPGGNVTGISSIAAEVVGKHFEALKEVAPSAGKVAVLWNPANSIFQATQRKAAERAGRALGMRLRFVDARTANEVDAAFAALSRERPDALVVLVDPVFAPLSSRIAQQAIQLRLPSVSGSADFVEAGGLMTYGPSYFDLTKRAAYFVDKILKGVKPADLPVEQPTKFEFAINKRTAKTLGLTIPTSLLLRMDHVID